jgi:hypothetical protein
MSHIVRPCRSRSSTPITGKPFTFVNVASAQCIMRAPFVVIVIAALRSFHPTGQVGDLRPQ